MDETLLQFTITAFVMLIVVINPVAVAPVFVSVTRGMGGAERRGVLNRAVVVAYCVALFFLVAGRGMLSYLGVSMHAFAVSGGILLFLIALPMLFGQRSSLQSPAGSEPPGGGEDVAIFPMAIPMLAGPGTIATVLVLATQAGRDVRRIVALAVVLGCIYVLSWPILHASDRIITRIGEGKVAIITRVLGIILAALAVQYVFNGITGYSDWLAARTP
ncbi:MAG TPA: MarC family protein [Thermoanaerobaculia bacterium]|nr:MarC family protein [Thermoanaerobaculia bacterium]